MIKELSVEELMKWKDKGFGHVELIIVKTRNCPKCIKFLNHFDKYLEDLDNFGYENVAVFTQENTSEYEASRKFFQELNLSSVPAVLYKQDKNVCIKFTDNLYAFDTWMEVYLEIRKSIEISVDDLDLI